MRLQFEEARTLYEHALRTARELGQPVLAAQLAFNAGEVELRAGEAARAESILRNAEGVFMDVGDSFFLASVAAMRGQALLELGHLEEAAAEAARARDLAAEDDLDAQSRWRGVHSAVLLARGEPDEAVALARSALDMARSADEPMITARALADLSTALRAAGDEAGATASRDEALAIYAAKGDRASFERLTSRLG